MYNNPNYIDCLRQNKEAKEGTLFLRSKGRAIVIKKSLKVKVNYALWKKYWNDKDQCFKSQMPDYKKLNDIIEKAFKEVAKYDGSLVKLAEKVKSDKIKIIRQDSRSFIAYWRALNETIKNHGTRTKNETVVNKIFKYLQSIDKTNMPFAHITPEFMRKLQHYLVTVADPKKLSNNQATHYLKMMKSVINMKIKEDPKLYEIHPYVNIKLTTNPDDIDRSILNEEDIAKLLTTKIEDEKVDLWRNMLLFETFAAGMRVSDLMFLRWNNIKTGGKLPMCKIEYKMFKTGKTMSVPLTVNLCIVLMKLVGPKLKGYDDLILDCYEENRKFIDYFKEHNGQVREMYPMVFEKELRLKCVEVKKQDYEMNQFIDIERDAVNGLIHYKTYSFSHEIENEMKAAIDYLEKLLVQMEETFIVRTALAIKRYKAQYNENHFIFPHLSNEVFSNIDSRNNFDDIDEAQYNKLKNAEILFNRQLKTVATTLGITNNLKTHSGRHSYTQMMLNDDIPTHLIKQQLGHSSVKVTDVYLRNKFNADKGDAVTNQIANKRSNRLN